MFWHWMGDKPEAQSINLQCCEEEPETNSSSEHPCALVKLMSNWKWEFAIWAHNCCSLPSWKEQKGPLFTMALVPVPPSGRTELAFRLKYNYSFFLLLPINYMQFTLKRSVTVLILAITILQQKHCTTLHVCKCFQRWNFKLKSSHKNILDHFYNFPLWNKGF